jgi:hypothetical protein
MKIGFFLGEDMSKIRFNSGFRVLSEAFLGVSERDVKNEPMLFSADLNFAEKNGGPLTREFIKHLPTNNGYVDYIIDSRVHMLMQGWYPCIPGWHLDDVPRTRLDGQPDHVHPAYKAENIMTIIGDASITEFIDGPIELEDIGFKEGAVYGKWNAEINRMLKEKDCKISVKQVPEKSVLHFGYGAFHRGVPATKTGWRFFIRANFNTAREIKNEIRKQTQVYLPTPEAGW